MMEQGGVVVHTAAGHQAWAPLEGLVVRREGVAVRTSAADAAGEAVSEQREVLHWGAEDRTGVAAIETVILAVRVGDENTFQTHILAEVVSDATDRAFIHRRKGNSLRL